ncbi:hypothetical protein ACMFMG_001316 [Clarireedia jacksonii]
MDSATRKSLQSRNDGEGIVAKTPLSYGRVDGGERIVGEPRRAADFGEIGEENSAGEIDGGKNQGVKERLCDLDCWPLGAVLVLFNFIVAIPLSYLLTIAITCLLAELVNIHEKQQFTSILHLLRFQETISQHGQKILFVCINLMALRWGIVAIRRWREDWLQEMEVRKWDKIIERLEGWLEESREVGRVMRELGDGLEDLREERM